MQKYSSVLTNYNPLNNSQNLRNDNLLNKIKMTYGLSNKRILSNSLKNEPKINSNQTLGNNIDNNFLNVTKNLNKNLNSNQLIKSNTTININNSNTNYNFFKVKEGKQRFKFRINKFNSMGDYKFNDRNEIHNSFNNKSNIKNTHQKIQPIINRVNTYNFKPGNTNNTYNQINNYNNKNLNKINNITNNKYNTIDAATKNDFYFIPNNMSEKQKSKISNTINNSQIFSSYHKINTIFKRNINKNKNKATIKPLENLDFFKKKFASIDLEYSERIIRQSNININEANKNYSTIRYENDFQQNSDNSDNLSEIAGELVESIKYANSGYKTNIENNFEDNIRTEAIKKNERKNEFNLKNNLIYQFNNNNNQYNEKQNYNIFDNKNQNFIKQNLVTDNNIIKINDNNTNNNINNVKNISNINIINISNTNNINNINNIKNINNINNTKNHKRISNFYGIKKINNITETNIIKEEDIYRKINFNVSDFGDFNNKKNILFKTKSINSNNKNILQLEKNPLIEDSILNIPLIIKTLKYNKVMKSNSDNLTNTTSSSLPKILFNINKSENTKIKYNNENEKKPNDLLINQIMSKFKNKEKSKQNHRVKINLSNNIIIHFNQNDLITKMQIYKKQNDNPLPSKENLLKTKIYPYPIIKKNFNLNDIKINKNYKLVENLDEKQIVPELYKENSEDCKSLEKSLEKSIDKLFYKYCEKPIDKSKNFSNNHFISQPYARNSQIKEKNTTEGGLISKLNKIFDDVSENKNEVENENSKKEDDGNNEIYVEEYY